ncbi:MAG: hypothetical protein H0X07_01700 [Gemmatimonadales bacterium]|nr:hypothetical protein [Gemmatimonadales bacterium]
MVPAKAPASVPAWVRADSNLSGPSASIPFRFRKNLLIVQFRQEATQVERQAAVDLVSDSVVGGSGNDIYLVRVADPGGGSALVQASKRLQEAPDRVPAWLSADSSFRGLTVHPDAVSPEHRRGSVTSDATASQRQTAIDLIQGRVIGGPRAAGIYLVRVEDPGDGSGIMKAVERLEALPSVAGATPDLATTPND